MTTGSEIDDGATGNGSTGGHAINDGKIGTLIQLLIAVADD
jgi:hypothetical protein